MQREEHFIIESVANEKGKAEREERQKEVQMEKQMKRQTNKKKEKNRKKYEIRQKEETLKKEKNIADTIISVLESINTSHDSFTNDKIKHIMLLNKLMLAINVFNGFVNSRSKTWNDEELSERACKAVDKIRTDMISVINYIDNPTMDTIS